LQPSWRQNAFAAFADLYSEAVDGLPEVSQASQSASDIHLAMVKQELAECAVETDARLRALEAWEPQLVQHGKQVEAARAELSVSAASLAWLC
jgi:hypothetical protein